MGNVARRQMTDTVESLELHGLGGSELYAGWEVIQVKRLFK